MTISVNVNDSPKLYFRFKDIYGGDFTPEYYELDRLTYTVYRIENGRAIPVEDFVDVVIPEVCWKSPPAPYPEGIQGLDAEAIAEGYTLELLPYRDEGNERFVSPFRRDRTTYFVVVSIEYYMDDAALPESATLRRDCVVQVVTGANR